MKIKHKVIKEFQYLSPDKKIFILKIGAILEEYIYKVKTELIPIDKAIIDNNPEFFEVIDWKAELLTFMRAEKMPQPAQLGKKLIPFFEDMIMSSIQHDNVPSMDPSLMKDVERRESELNTFKRDLDRRETDLDSRDRRIKDKEDELLIRIKRVEKREDEYKLDVKSLEKKEDDLRLRTRTTTEKELDLQDKIQELNERERNIDRSALMSSKEIDAKYIQLQNKIDSDLADLSSREKELEIGFKKVKELESQLENNISQINEVNRNKIYADLEAELKGIESEVRNIDLISNKLFEFSSERKANGFEDDPFVSHVSNDLMKSIKKLKERVDNNLLD
jgi:DNA repair exonuclease SbcCD ATPase subunit